MSILTLSGWTQPTNALADHIPGAHGFDYSEYKTPSHAIEALRQFHDTSTIVGWSLGGWLAMRAIAAGALAPKSLVLLAPAFQFVNDDTFIDGMPKDTFAQFRSNYAADPVRTLNRFHGLIAKGDKHMRTVMDKLSHHETVSDTDRWLPWLDALAETSLHDIRLSTRHIHLIHGDADAIVPVAQSAYLLERHPHMTLSVWEGASHAPHLHDTKRFQEIVKTSYAH
ncbi:MAG: hypothetical protein C0436_02160 [Alphaproteobacteria bacterium]|nr:hypothetical protein [Alphaproteobacteria bacterium]